MTAPITVRVVCLRCDGSGDVPFSYTGDRARCLHCVGSGSVSATLAPGEFDRLLKERIMAIRADDPLWGHFREDTLDTINRDLCAALGVSWP